MKAIKNSAFLIKNNDKNVTRSTKNFKQSCSVTIPELTHTNL